MASHFSYAIARLALADTVRLTASARLRDPVLRKLAGAALADDLAEIEAATSGRLSAERRGGDALSHRELVAGMPQAAFINAAFAYWRPRQPNRFTSPGRGAWYAALQFDTAIAEVSFHMTRELERVADFHATVDYAELSAGFAGAFVDLRGLDATPDRLHPDPAVGYVAGNALADSVRADGHNGIIYPSVRDAGGTCLVALWPHAVQSVVEGGLWRLRWRGVRTPTVERLA